MEREKGLRKNKTTAVMPDGSRFSGKNLLEGKRTVVTGGGAGIGKQISYTLAEQGARVVILDYKQELAEAAAEIINNKFGRGTAMPVVGNVSDRPRLKECFDGIERLYEGALDAFVNNAGISHPCRIEDLTSDDEAEKALRQIMVNQAGAYWCAAYAYPLLVKGNDPVFIMMGSCASVGSEGQGVYGGTKAALRGLLGTLVKEWAATADRQAVRVGLIEPDYFESTALRDQQYLTALARARRTVVEEVANEAVARAKIPLKREGKLVEIAEKVVMMILDSYSSGNVEVLSGGKTVRL
jgi:3-oxoacyl-[acyl-carrier protein] reductase